jgi:cytochrome c oxidase subunit 2
VRWGAVGSIAVLALVLATPALAGNGGVAPPTPHSPGTARIEDVYWLILAITGGIFLLVEGALVVFVVKYRNRGRPRTAEGPQIVGHTRLEIIWTVLPVLILAAIASFVFYKLPGIKDVPAAKAQGGPLTVNVIAHQFYWEFRYPNGAVSIDEMHAPVGRVVKVQIHSQDVDHSWWIPELHAKFDAIPGRTNETWFRASQAGVYPGQCGEFCGIFHARMDARVLVEPVASYRQFVSATATRTLGSSIFHGACAKCHGFQGQGDYGPSLKASAVAQSAQSLAQIVRNGRDSTLPGVMPPVGRGWTQAEMNALVKYVQGKVVGH